MSLVIDAHTHAWSEACPLAPGRRYTPPYSRDVESLLAAMAPADVGRAVLVQPSFLGTDNRYLLEQLQRYPDRLRGVVVVDPAIEPAEFAAMVAQGVTGVRLNLIGAPLSGQQLVERYGALLELLKAHHCHLEIQSQGEQWQQLLPAVMASGVTLVVDHFGRPASHDCAGFAAILEGLESGRLWVKLSGWYRFNADPAELAGRLLAAAPERLVWGSDYPWTQHEAGRSYQACKDNLARWTGGRELEAILVHNPSRLFGFERA